MKERLILYNHYNNDAIRGVPPKNPAMGRNFAIPEGNFDEIPQKPQDNNQDEKISTIIKNTENENIHSSHNLNGEFILNKENDTNINHIVLGEWNIKYSHETIVFPENYTQEAISLLARWAEAFPEEDTWVRNELGVPSLLVRMDLTIHDNKLRVFEVEERPAGIGATSLINPEFREHLLRLKKEWPEIGVVISSDPRRRGSDDHLWTEVVDPNKDLNKLLLIRAEPDEVDFHHLESRSISSLKRKGDKSYGEKLGLWRLVLSPDELPWDTAFVVKPKQGSKTRGMGIWVPRQKYDRLQMAGKKTIPGTHTRTKIERLVAEASQKGGLYCQEFYPPMESGLGTVAPWMIDRVFFGFNPSTGKWECMGGLWNARPTLIIHGADDAIFGPVTTK